MLENKTEVNAHKNCECEYVSMRTKVAGTATNQRMNGVDMYLMKYWKLPNYYVTKEAAKNAGWVSWRGNLDNVLPTSVIGGMFIGIKTANCPR